VIFSKATRARNPAERGRWKVTARELPIMARREAYEIVPELQPLPSETVLVKAAPSAFFGTDLVNLLVFHSIDTVILAGTVTSGCVRATAVDAFSYNFRVVIPEECVCDRGPTSHKVALFDIHMKYGDVRSLADVLAYLRGVKLGEATEPVKA
jgi:nicotinamidase-related amidase